MNAIRDLLCLASAICGVCALGGLPAVHAEGLASNAILQPALRADTLAGTRNSLGLNLGRDRLVGSFWGLELGYIDKPRLFTNEPHTQGLNLSLVGTAPLGESFGVFGKLGTNYSRGDTTVMSTAQDSPFGIAYGAGVSYSFTPRFSATLEWDSNDLRFSSAPRDPVRSTNLGLRWRY